MEHGPQTTITVADIMTSDPAFIRSNATLREALEHMSTLDVHHLPVLSERNNLVGIITARECRLALSVPELLREYWADVELADKLLVRDVMRKGATVASPEMSAAEAARLMLESYVSGLPVMRDETLVGIITVSDVLVAFVGMERRRRQPEPEPSF